MIDSENPAKAPPNKVPFPTFVSIGECMAELSPLAQADEFKLGFAGDTLNTAWYVRALASHWLTRYVTRVGTDAMSDAMVDMFSKAGLDTSHIIRDPHRSIGLYMISLADGERSFTYWRDSSAARQLANDVSALREATSDAYMIYVSGITLAIIGESGRDNLFRVMDTAKTAGKDVIFDSNLRPRLWRSAEQMTQTIMRAAAVSSVVLPSFDDEAEHFGDGSPEATRDRYLAAGAKTVIVKNGAGAIHFARDGKTGCVQPSSVTNIVDTTAAGDSFNAGLIVGLYQNMQTADAIDLACHVAGHVIGHKGALVTLPQDLSSASGPQSSL